MSGSSDQELDQELELEQELGLVLDDGDDESSTSSSSSSIGDGGGGGAGAAEDGDNSNSSSSSPAAPSPGHDEGVGTEKRRGRCKWFNVAKGWGFISPDDGGQDIFVHQSVVQMSGFRSLGDDEEVEFECKVSEKGLEATMVSGPDGTDCQGSHRRPATKKRFRKIRWQQAGASTTDVPRRCYNCGEFANHIAAKCTMGPQPKRCHHCKSEDHLIADCPTRKERKEGDKKEDGEKAEEKPSDIKSEPIKEGKEVNDATAAVPAAQPAASS